MGIIGRLLGTDTAIKETSHTVNNVFSTIAKGVDAVVHTSEEKANYILKMVEVVSRTFTAGDALARRLIAIVIVIWYFTAVTIIGVLRCLGKTDLAGELFNLVKADPPGYVTGILIAYFGYYGVKSGIRAWKGK